MVKTYKYKVYTGRFGHLFASKERANKVAKANKSKVITLKKPVRLKD